MAATDKKIKVRVIYAGKFGAVNDVVELDPKDVEAAKASGEVDADPAAVAYAESLKAE